MIQNINMKNESKTNISKAEVYHKESSKFKSLGILIGWDDVTDQSMKTLDKPTKHTKSYLLVIEKILPEQQNNWTVFVKTYWIRVLEDILKTSWRRPLANTSWKRLKRSLGDVLKKSWRDAAVVRKRLEKRKYVTLKMWRLNMWRLQNVLENTKRLLGTIALLIEGIGMGAYNCRD